MPVHTMKLHLGEGGGVASSYMGWIRTFAQCSM